MIKSLNNEIEWNRNLKKKHVKLCIVLIHNLKRECKHSASLLLCMHANRSEQRACSLIKTVWIIGSILFGASLVVVFFSFVYKSTYLFSHPISKALAERSLIILEFFVVAESTLSDLIVELRVDHSVCNLEHAIWAIHTKDHASAVLIDIVVRA